MSMINRVTFVSDQVIDDDVIHRCSLPCGGSISVLDRMTGFGWRDIETGYRSPCGGFWLASGGYDIRQHLGEFTTHEQMAQWVIERANVCTGDGIRTAYRRPMPECFA